MNLQDLTVDQVRDEVAQIIAKYPERNGSIKTDGDYDEARCVYYTDQYGIPIADTDEHYDDDPQLVTPVCLIGCWVEEFHPELKQDEVFARILRRNAVLFGVSNREELPLRPEVTKFLGEVQLSQDGGCSWSEIDVDVIYEVS